MQWKLVKSDLTHLLLKGDSLIVEKKMEKNSDEYISEKY